MPPSPLAFIQPGTGSRVQITRQEEKQKAYKLERSETLSISDGDNLTPYIKIHSELINDLSVRANTRKVLEEIAGVNIHDLIFGNGLNS